MPEQQFVEHILWVEKNIRDRIIKHSHARVSSDLITWERAGIIGRRLGLVVYKDQLDYSFYPT